MANAAQRTKKIWGEAGLNAALFLLAFIPRVIGLQRFVTADEAKWIYRSAQFWLALLAGDWAGTMVKLKPAVTTMWTGGLGLWVYNRFHQNLPFAEFLGAIPEFRVEPAMLQAARMPTILLTCAGIVLIYHLLRPIFGRWPSLLAGALLAFSPLYLAHSRFLHHDALMTLFAVPALLLAIQAAKGGWTALIFSAIFAGLAFLSKSPIFFLAPFVAGLFLAAVWLERDRVQAFPTRRLGQAIGRFAVWGLISYLTFLIVWPAAWVSPAGAPLAVILDALKEAAPKTGDDVFINLGPFYYPVYFAFYATPATLIGLIGWFFLRPSLNPQERFTTQALVWFALTFIMFMTLSNKRSARYILPAFVAVTLVAAISWGYWLARRNRLTQIIGVATLLAAQALAVIPYAPYYISYTNPLLGGPLTAPHLIKIGWGEGMDQIGAWLNRQPNAPANRVGAKYASTLTPYFDGQVRDPDAANLDYVVLYIKQRQSGSPPPPVQAYYDEVVGPVQVFQMAGIDYAYVYPAPAAQPVEGVSGLIAFRPQTALAPIGGEWTVDLIWDDTPETLPTLSLRGEGSQSAGEQINNLRYGAVTRHIYALPVSTPPGAYTLFAGDQPIGAAEARYTVLPGHFTPAEANFGAEIQLLGFNPAFNLSDEPVAIELAFRAAPKAWADYTVYVHVIDADGNRIAGHDAQPAPPTSQWLKGEVVLDRHTLSLPPDLPLDQTYHIRVGLYRADTGEALGESFILPADR